MNHGQLEQRNIEILSFYNDWPFHQNSEFSKCSGTSRRALSLTFLLKQKTAITKERNIFVMLVYEINMWPPKCIEATETVCVGSRNVCLLVWKHQMTKNYKKSDVFFQQISLNTHTKHINWKKREFCFGALLISLSRMQRRFWQFCLSHLCHFLAIDTKKGTSSDKPDKNKQTHFRVCLGLQWRGLRLQMHKALRRRLLCFRLESHLKRIMQMMHV